MFMQVYGIDLSMEKFDVNFIDAKGKENEKEVGFWSTQYNFDMSKTSLNFKLFELRVLLTTNSVPIPQYFRENGWQVQNKPICR